MELHPDVAIYLKKKQQQLLFEGKLGNMETLLYEYISTTNRENKWNWG